MSNNADPLDQAGLLTEQLNRAYLANAMAKSKPEQVPRADGSWLFPLCVDCDEELGARLTLGRIRCVHCQEDKERERRFAR